MKAYQSNSLIGSIQADNEDKIFSDIFSNQKNVIVQTWDDQESN